MGTRSLEREGLRSKDQETEEPEGETGELVDRLFADAQAAERVAQDPLYIFLKNNWRQLFVVSAGLAAAFFIYQKFTETYNSGMERASATYAQVQRAYTEYTRLGDQSEKASSEAAKAAPDKKSEADKKAAMLKARRDAVRSQLEASMTALENERRPYSSLAPIYRALLARADGNLDGVRSALKNMDWRSISNADSNERFAAELAGLTLAKALLDKPTSFDEGRAALKALAEGGSTAHVSAAIALLRSARTSEERSEAFAAAEALKEKHPEQKALIDAEIGGQF